LLDLPSQLRKEQEEMEIDLDSDQEQTCIPDLVYDESEQIEDVYDQETLDPRPDVLTDNI
jgi:hypothetical protein